MVPLPAGRISVDRALSTTHTWEVPYTIGMLEKDAKIQRRPLTVVFADDDPGVRRLVEILLGFEPYITLLASVSTGTKAVELVKLHRPDILVTDFRLPDIDGLEVCNRVSLEAPGVQLLVVSGFASAEMEGELLMAGFTFVEKTQAFADFAGLVRRVVDLNLTRSPDSTPE